MRVPLLIFSLLSVFFLRAQDTVRAELQLSQATVYLGYGAELVHQGKFRVGPDTRTIVLTGMALQVDPASIQISLPESVPLLSQQFRLMPRAVAAVTRDPKLEAMEDSIKTIRKEIRRIDNLIGIETEVLNKTGTLIETTISTADNKSVASSEVIKLVEVYTARIEKSKTNIFNYSLKREELEESVAAIRTRSSLIVRPGVNRGNEAQLVLQVLPHAGQEIPLSVSYYTQNAGWTAGYDIRVNSKTNKVKLVYKASVSQTTGIDWKKTKLTLSTGTPTFGTAAPVLTAWQLQLYVPEVYEQMKQTAIMNNKARNSIPSALEGRVPGLAMEEVSVSGYRVVERKDVTASVQTIDPSTLGNFTSFNPGQLNNNYEIDLPYDIPTDGALRSVTIKNQEIDCLLKDYAVPRMNKDAFLLAEVADWQNLDLLPGQANIIMDDTYIGKTAIDPNTTADTLNLSLGRDQRVAVARVLVKEQSGIKASGGNSKQTYTYELTVKNNKLTNVTMLLKDQYPISTIKEVEVKLEEEGGASVNPEIGVLTWKLDLKPGESRKVRFSYSIKAPKDKKILNPR